MSKEKSPEDTESTENVNPVDWMDADDDVEAIGGIDAYLSDDVDEEDSPSDPTPY